MRILHVVSLACGFAAMIVSAAGYENRAEKGGGETSPFVVVAQGDPEPCVIELRSPGFPSAVYAAEELRDYAERITDVKMEIVANAVAGRRVVISVEGADEDGFALKVKDGYLAITGGKRGILYGVYEVLETYGGVGWFSSWCEVVPKRNSLAVPGDLDREERPAIAIRDVLWKDTYEGDFAARLRINGTWFHKTTERHGRGADFLGGGLGLCHTFPKLLPASRYFAAHPEYFCEINGKRLNRREQLCLTNPDIVGIVASNVLDRISNASGSPYFGVSQNDWENYCRCSRCAAVDEGEGSHSGTMVRFINQIADVVAERHPDKIIETLAYNYTRKPPKFARYRPNVMPCLCTSGCESSKPLTESRYSENVAFVEDAKGWAAQARQMYFWDYVTDFNAFLRPYANLRALQSNLKFFRDLGARGVLMQGDHIGWHGEMAELKAWLTAKWMWNPELNANDLVKRFLCGYYGKAAPMVMEYLKLLHSLGRDEAVAPLRHYGGVCMDPTMTEEFIDAATTIWLRALEAVRNDAVRSYNVRMGLMAIDYTCYMKKAREFNASTREIPVLDDVSRRFKVAFEDAARAGRPVELFEHGIRDRKKHADLVKQISTNALKPLIHSKGEGCALLEESAFTLLAEKDKVGIRDDVTASGGKALWIAADNRQWYTQFKIERLRYDSQRKYRVRIRLRIVDAVSRGVVLRFGVYDNRSKACTTKSIAGEEVREGYAWYELPPCSLMDSQVVWIAPGLGGKGNDAPQSKEIWVDQIEIKQAEGTTH